MVIGNDYRDPARVGGVNPHDARSTVVHRNQQVRFAPGRDLDDFRSEAVPEAEAVGHEVVDLFRPEKTKPAYRHRTAGRAVRIEVPHDEDAPALLERLDEQRHGGPPPRGDSRRREGG